jgi:uncharacterized protein YciI
MPQYLILAKDGTDADAQNRRLKARPFHIETAKKLKAAGHLILGGATLDENEVMNGSVMIVEFENKQVLYEWLDNDPYVTQEVWKSVEVKPFKIANI